MKIYVKIRFDASISKFEKVLGDSYLLYVSFSYDGSSELKVKEILSRKFGVPVKNIYLISYGKNNEWIFNLS